MKGSVIHIIALLALTPDVHAASCAGPACCTVYGTPAVCRSPVIERQAKAIVLRRCPRCDPRAVTCWINSYQTNEGPYESARDLACHVERAMRGGNRC